MSASAVSPTKDEWRSRFRDYRRTLPPDQYRAKSTLICVRALTLAPVAGASVIHVYWPQTDRREIDTRPLIQALRGRGATVVLPVVTSYDPAAPTMEHRRYEGPDALSPNRWGVGEPTGTARVAPDALDVVIVPALGADRTGTRLGYGAGYYDTFLRDTDVPRILLTYTECLVPTLPAEAHDVPVTRVVTERCVLATDGS